MNFPEPDLSLPGHIYNGEISSFFNWISSQEKIKHIPENIMKIIFSALKKSDSLHENDKRKWDNSPYIHHILRVVKSIVEKYPIVYPADILALTLHDALEDHPKCWYDILAEFGLEVFRNVLILSKISLKTRTEILEWFIEVTPIERLDDPIIWNILQILNPQDPLIKLEYFSVYSNDEFGQDKQRMRWALLLYRDKIIIPKGWDYEKDDEYISLGNYLYFEKKDARRKLQDMLDNMWDMKIMEKRKPGYIEKRRIKAYILWVKLKNFGMDSEYSELQWAFSEAWFTMLQDSDVLSITQNVHSESH